MPRPVPRSGLRALALLAAAVFAACEGGAAPGILPEAADAEGPERLARYTRDFVFLGEMGEAPLVVPFTFSSVAHPDSVVRTARGWLAHGPTWDPFLDERHASATPAAPEAVWRVLPLGGLRVVAGGSTEVEVLSFRQGERALRLRLQQPVSSWNRGEDARYRLVRGRVSLGGELIPGTVLEVQRARRTPGGAPEAAGEFDWLFLTDGSEIQLLLAEAMGGAQPGERTFGWTSLGGSERSWDAAEIRWLDMRPYERARRDIPVRWSYRIPEAGVFGEVQAVGYDVTVGAERGGRRSVEVRYTVDGWVEAGGDRYPVYGMIRHLQD